MDNRRRLNNEINPPEVLSTQDTRLRRKKQHNKSKERDAVKLSGSIDLGMSKKSLRRNKTTVTTTTTEHPNEIPKNFQAPQQPSSNHHRHNHNSIDYDKNENYRKMMMTSTSTQYPITYQLPMTSKPMQNAHSSSHKPPQSPDTTVSTKQIEKVNVSFSANAS